MRRDVHVHSGTQTGNDLAATVIYLRSIYAGARAADAYSRIAFSRSVGTACRLSCSARFATSSSDRAVLFRAFRCSRDSPLFLFWLNANPTNPNATNTAPAIINQGGYSIAEPP